MQAATTSSVNNNNRFSTLIQASAVTAEKIEFFN